MMQESVGATAARAGIWLLKLYRDLGLQARPMIILYDSVVTICPLEERHIVARLHELCMHERNTWTYNDERGYRVLKYPIDNEFNYRWSTAPEKADQLLLASKEFHPTPPDKEWLLTCDFA